MIPLVYKNKGLMVVIYLFSCFLGSFILMPALQIYIGGIFLKFDRVSTIGVGVLCAALLTNLNKDTYYKDDYGKKVMMDMENSFFNLSMKVWAYIFLIGGLAMVSNMFLHYYIPPPFY